MDMYTVLSAARSSDNVIRKQAEDALSGLEGSNFAIYITALAHELKSEEKPENIRQLAGLLIKNALDSDTESVAAQKHQRWNEQADAVRAQVKNDLVVSLSSAAPNARQAAAQAVAKVGKIELPARQWPELIEGLANAAFADGVPDGTKAASVTALGYLCEEIDDPDVMEQADRDKILSAIVTNMSPAVVVEVRRAAVAGLNHALDFAEQSFSDARAAERDAIVGAVSACATDGDKAVRTSAFDCMLRVADLYYASLRPYIEQLAGITSAAALGPEEDVAVRAVEFWNSIAEEEKELELTDPSNCQYIKTYVAPLVGMLTSLMRKVEEEHDDEAYTIAQAASNCLTSVALAAQDAVVPPVMEFIASAFGSPEWQQRDAATVAFGCVQEGPSEEQLKPLIATAVGTLISRLAGPGADPSTQVRDSTAWALCKIMEANFGLVDHAAHYAALLDAIFAALADEARVAANAAWIVHNMAPHMVDYEMKDGSTPLTPYFQRLCETLIVRADREDWEEHKLRTVCYEAVNMLVEGAVTEHEHPFLNTLLMEVGRRLTLAVNAAPAASPDERRNIESQLVLLAALTQALSGELDAEIAPVAPGLVELLMRAMDAHNAIAAENALYAIGSIADAVGESFKPMLPALMPKLQAAVTKVANTSVCEAGVWACGEIVRNAGSAVLPYIEGVINSLLELLKSAESPRRAKTTALAVFGDVATAMGPAVHTYIRGMMLIIHRAALTSAESDDEEDARYLISLRTAVAEAWQGMFQAFIPEEGVTAAGKAAMKEQSAVLGPYIPEVLALVKTWLQEAAAEGVEHELDILKVLVGLLGDIATVCGKAHMGGFVRKDEPWLRRALDLEDRLERESWSSEHDSAGRRKQTIAQFARKVLP